MKRYFVIAFTLLLILSSFGVTAFADDSNVTYSGNEGIYIFDFESELSLTDLFPDLKDLMPGDTVTQRITVKNNANNKVKIKIYIRSNGKIWENNEGFLSKLDLTVKAGATPFFEGSADEAGSLSEWKELGMLYSGGSVDLDLTLKVPTSLDNSYQKSIGEIGWEFNIIEIPVGEEKWVCPKCKESKYKIIEDEDGHCIYVCEKCGHREYMRCEVCGALMHKVIYKSEDGRTWYYYECEGDHRGTSEVVIGHHTEPVEENPKTGAETFVLIAAAFAVLSLAFIFITANKRRKNSGCGK